MEKNIMTLPTEADEELTHLEHVSGSSAALCGLIYYRRALTVHQFGEGKLERLRRPLCSCCVRGAQRHAVELLASVEVAK